MGPLKAARSIKVEFRRNRSNDYQTFTGFGAYWPEQKTPIKGSMGGFCQKGVKLLFGGLEKDKESYLLELIIREVANRKSPKLRLLPGCRCQRLLMRVEEHVLPHWFALNSPSYNEVTLWFNENHSTDLYFNDKENPRSVMRWLAPDAKSGAKERWIDLYVIEHDMETKLPCFLA